MQLVHLEIAGHVQGVGFRHYIREHAQRLRLIGWVRNLSSGNVECTLAGDASAVEAMLALVRQGPPGAQVKQVITLLPPAHPDLPSPFTILR